MARANDTMRRQKEFGDYQTPDDLARRVCALLVRRGLRPATVVEPTCGVGGFLFAALDVFPNVARSIGVEINADALAALARRASNRGDSQKIEAVRSDFFQADWHTLLRSTESPLLVLGNPPWVTNADLGAMQSGNLPAKSNFHKLDGIDALTGKSNFDISEWMLLRLLEALDGTSATMAMLCKTAVARKVLAYCWKRGVSLESAAVYGIDAQDEFDVAVDACLFLCDLSPGGECRDCNVYADLDAEQPYRRMGWRDGTILTNLDAFARWGHLRGDGPFQWRSGIKHDCSKVMELVREGDLFRNGLDEAVNVEDEHVFPMLKSSDVASGNVDRPKRWMIVPQFATNQDTLLLCSTAPRLWNYLESHADRLDRRASSIYKKRSRFAVFGVGDYSFAPWKVVVSAFYRRPLFVPVGPYADKPCVLDDTCYMLATSSREEAVHFAELLNSAPATGFFEAFASPDAKRTITIEILRQLDVQLVARELGVANAFERCKQGAPRSLFESLERS